MSTESMLLQVLNVSVLDWETNWHDLKSFKKLQDVVNRGIKSYGLEIETT